MRCGVANSEVEFSEWELEPPGVGELGGGGGGGACRHAKKIALSSSNQADDVAPCSGSHHYAGENGESRHASTSFTLSDRAPFRGKIGVVPVAKASAISDAQPDQYSVNRVGVNEIVRFLWIDSVPVQAPRRSGPRTS